MSLDMTLLWFQRAMPSPSDKNRRVQLGCHFEEVAEMFRVTEKDGTQHMVMTSDDVLTAALLDDAYKALHRLADALKDGTAKLPVIVNRRLFIDSIADQLVTGTGTAYVNQMKPTLALERTNTSNWSKYDDNGQPIFDGNGKISKGPNYQIASYEGCY